MSRVTHILSAIEEGAPHAAEQLLPLVYDELRKLAAQKMSQEAPGQTLQATALVHEAYLRLVANPGRESGVREPQWNSRGHFFAAAAESIRRILIERARWKCRAKHGGERQRIDLNEALSIADAPSPAILDLDEALKRLEVNDPLAANLVKLRYFGGLSMPKAAEALGISLRNAERNWTYARTWLHREIAQLDPNDLDNQLDS